MEAAPTFEETKGTPRRLHNWKPAGGNSINDELLKIDGDD